MASKPDIKNVVWEEDAPEFSAPVLASHGEALKQVNPPKQSVMQRVFNKQNLQDYFSTLADVAGTVGSLVTNPIQTAAAGLYGLASGGKELVTGEGLDKALQTGAQAVEEGVKALSYAPTTGAGKTLQEVLSYPFVQWNEANKGVLEERQRLRGQDPLDLLYGVGAEVAPFGMLAKKGGGPQDLANAIADARERARLARVSESVASVEGPVFKTDNYAPRWQEELPLLQQNAGGRTAVEIPQQHVTPEVLQQMTTGLGPGFDFLKEGNRYYIYDTAAWPDKKVFQDKIKSGEYGDVLGKGTALTSEQGQVFRAVERDAAGEPRILTDPSQVTVKDGTAQNIIDAGMYKGNEADLITKDIAEKAGLTSEAADILNAWEIPGVKRAEVTPQAKASTIFLHDWDGVFNTVRGTFDKRAIANWNKVADKVPDSGIVIMSNHRLSRTLPELQQEFEAAGGKGKIVGVTGKLGDRVAEIQDWQQQFGQQVGAKRYIAFDDAENLAALKDNWIKTNPDVGVTAADAKRAISLAAQKGPEALVTPDVPVYSSPEMIPIRGGSGVAKVAPERAGNINLQQFDVSTASKETLHDVSQFYEGAINDARRGTMSWQETREVAGKKPFSPLDLLRRKSGQALNPEQTVQAKDILHTSVQWLDKIKEEALATGTDEALVKLRVAMDYHATLQAQYSGAAAEAGRTLNVHKMLSQEAKGYKAMLDAVGGRELSEEILLELAKVDTGSIEAVNKFVSRYSRVTTLDKLYEAYISGLVSGPITHIKNILSNFVGVPMKLAETASTAAIEGVRATLTNTPRERFFTEAPAQVVGMTAGLKEGVRAFLKARAEDIPSDRLLKNDAFKPAIPGKIGHFIRGPLRYLNAEDLFFKAIFNSMERYTLAAQEGVKKGLTGEKLVDDIAVRVANPTPGMIDKGATEATYRTYNQELGKYGRHLAALRQIPGGRWLVPFLRISINLPKFFLERTLLNAPRVAYKAWKGELQGGALSAEVGKIVTGSLIGAVLTKYAMDGFIVGGAPKDRAAREAFYRSGKTPYSVKIGDNYVPFGWLEPAGSFGAVADFVELANSNMEEKKVADLAGAVGLSISRNITSKTWMQTVSALIEAFDEPERYGSAFTERFAGSFVPGAVFTGTKMLDPQLHQVEGPMEAVQSRLPYLSDALLPKRDIWGRVQNRPGNIAERGFAPTPITSSTTDPVEIEVQRLGLKIGQPSKNIRGVELSPAEYDIYSKFAGEQAYYYVKDVIDKPMNDAVKADVIVRLVERARREAAAQMLSTNANVQAGFYKRLKEKAEKYGQVPEAAKALPNSEEVVWDTD